MRRVICLLAGAIFVCCLALPGAVAAAPALTIVYTSHLADIQRHTPDGGLPQLAALLHELRRRPEPVVFIHGGNVLGPSPLSSFDKGAHMIGLLNLLAPDVMAVGRRDLMHKEDELALRASEAVFPVVVSNLLDPLTGREPGGLEQISFIPADNYHLGLAALVSPEVETSYIQERVRITGGYELLPHFNALLREGGAQFVVNTADFLPPDPQAALAASGADLLIIADSTENRAISHDGKGWVMLGKEGYVLIVTLTAAPGQKNNKLAVSAIDIVHLGDYPADPEVNAAVQSYTRSLDALLSMPVGTITTPLNTTTQTLRTSENAFANLVTDAMRTYYGSETAIINAGGIRGNRTYAAGTDLTRRELQAELPLHDTSCLTEVTGQALLDALEHGVSGVQSARGRFLQISGVRFTFDPDAPEGQRVRAAHVNGKALEPAQHYTLTAPTYIIKQGDGFTMFDGVCITAGVNPPQELLELVRTYITQRSPVAPVVEGRITVVK